MNLLCHPNPTGWPSRVFLSFAYRLSVTFYVSEYADDAAARLAARGLGYRVHGSIDILLRAIRC